MKVCVQKLLLVFLAAVQGSGVTEDFEADCTITDNINKIVRRLRLSSSRPYRQDVEVKYFGSDAGQKVEEDASENKTNGRNAEDLIHYQDSKPETRITELKSKKQNKVKIENNAHQDDSKQATKEAKLSRSERTTESSLSLKQDCTSKQSKPEDKTKAKMEKAKRSYKVDTEQLTEETNLPRTEDKTESSLGLKQRSKQVTDSKPSKLETETPLKIKRNKIETNSSTELTNLSRSGHTNESSLRLKERKKKDTYSKQSRPEAEYEVEIKRNKRIRKIEIKPSTELKNLSRREDKNKSSFSLIHEMKQDTESKHPSHKKEVNVSSTISKSNLSYQLDFEERKSIAALVQIKIKTLLDTDSSNDSTSNQLKVSHQTNGSLTESKCMFMYSKKEKEECNKVNHIDKQMKNDTSSSKPKTMTENLLSTIRTNSTKATPLILGSCTYIDLTMVQAKCGPGYKAMVEKQEPGLHHSIFFDNTSGNIIYAVHRENRWQCCKSSRNMTSDVPCSLGARCA